MISAKIIADSISPNGKRIITYELDYPRFILAEVNTHRAFSRNSASSRAIPLKTMIGLVWNNPATPVYWGKNKGGMSANEELSGLSLYTAKFLWKWTGRLICGFAWLFDKIKLHKQISNRILEPWSHMKTIMTTTEDDNWFHLRRDKDAQPEIHELADKMWIAKNKSIPTRLPYGGWHLPYIIRIANGKTKKIEYAAISEKSEIGQLFDLETAKKVSVSMCAQVSYRKSDESVDKALKIYDRLLTSARVHASPFEHQATPLQDIHKNSGNFKGWLQYRQTIKNHVCYNYNED